MGHLAKISDKGLIALPSRIREKYGIEPGSSVRLIEQESGILVVPQAKLSAIYGMGAHHKEKILEAIRELEKEHDKQESQT